VLGDLEALKVQALRLRGEVRDDPTGEVGGASPLVVDLRGLMRLDWGERRDRAQQLVAGERVA
jgi:hypothetical protein